MSRTVTAFYDTRAEAEAARDRLASEVDVEGRARIIDKSAAGPAGQAGSSGFRSVPLTHEDRHAYGEGLKRGGFMLCAEVDEDEDADRIVSILDQTSSVDMDERQDSWKTEGWQPYNAASTAGTAPVFAAEERDTRINVEEERFPVVEEEYSVGEREAGRGGSRVRSFVKIGGVAAAAVGAVAAARAMKGKNENPTARGVEEQRVPIVEEELEVGKREVSTGGARVHTSVAETPVNEQVKLREEHVSVERRPVSGEGSQRLGEDAFQERDVEMTGTAEVPVVDKKARVTEEVVVRKSAQERTENVHDTVRHTEVDVDESRSSNDRSAMNFGGGDKTN